MSVEVTLSLWPLLPTNRINLTNNANCIAEFKPGHKLLAGLKNAKSIGLLDSELSK